MPETWTVIVPIKSLAAAKSRITVDSAVRRDLAIAVLDDTLRAVAGCTRVRRTVVVAGDSRPPEELNLHGAQWLHDKRGAGLNHAIVSAIEEIGVQGPVSALPADLPCLSSGALNRVLRRAERHARGFVADASGQGTTALTALEARELSPAYGSASAAAHAANGHRQLRAARGLRLDVDTLADLSAALGDRPGARSTAAARRAPVSTTPRATAPSTQPLLQHLSVKGTS